MNTDTPSITKRWFLAASTLSAISANLFVSQVFGMVIDHNSPSEKPTLVYDPHITRAQLYNGLADALYPDQWGDYGQAASAVCMNLILSDPGNVGRGFLRAPEYYELANATCIEPAYSPLFKVFCRKKRSQGVTLVDGPVTEHRGSCDANAVCLDNFGQVDFLAPGGRWFDSVMCVGEATAQVQRIRKEIEAKEWCSRPQLLSGSDPSKQASFKLTMEISSSSASGEEIEQAHFWFEIISDQWRYLHRLAEWTGRGTSAIVNTAPSLGDTYVKFCTIVAGDKRHKILPWVGILYSKTLMRRRGNIHEEPRPVLNIES